MSYNSFVPEVFEAFLFGGAAAAIFATTSYIVNKTHRHSDKIYEHSDALFQHSVEMEKLLERIEKCEERQDQQLKK